MALVRWQPFREIDTLQREMNRLFEDWADDLAPTPRGSNGSLSFVPAAELEETADAYHLRLEIPGLKREDLDIHVTASSVSIRGERKAEAHSEDQGKTRTEFRYGKFQRVIPLSGRIDHQNAQAEYRDGILTLNLPKAEEEKNRVMKVNIA